VDKTEFEINVLGAARATGAPLHGGAFVFEDDCGVRLLEVEIKQDTTKQNYIVGISEAATYSASAVDKATQPCVLLVQRKRS
jgi:hypothetical protein